MEVRGLEGAGDTDISHWPGHVGDTDISHWPGHVAAFAFTPYEALKEVHTLRMLPMLLSAKWWKQPEIAKPKVI